jgi:steroid delta-isomerase-like uncharacterized protein
MSSKQNKGIVRHRVEEIFNKKNLDYIDVFYASDVVDHSAPPGLPPGIEGYRLKIGSFVAAFPDLNISYEDLISEGNKVSGRYTPTGTHQGDFAGIPPTGKQVKVSGMDILRLKDDKIAEHWTEMDTLGMMQQLGVIPGSSAS